jgi:hypothetical protein
MGMIFFWLTDAVEQVIFDIKYYPEKENLADYQSKHHIVWVLIRATRGMYAVWCKPGWLTS